MEFGVLGSLEVTEDGRRLELGGGKQRALLAMLLLHPNEIVSSDRLIDALWEETPPEGARKTLHVHISGLRKVLGKERLETRTPGYLLRVGSEELDSDRFERLAGEGRVEEALALWRGPCLEEFAYHRFAQAAIERLEELRLGCLEARIEQDLAAGRHASLVGELEGLVRTHPLRERLRAQLMLALYRSGRQAEALDAYAAARRALVDDLGLDPSRELRELESAILRQDPALDPPPPGPLEQAAPPPPISPSAPVTAKPGRAERKTVTAIHVRMTATSQTGEELDPEVLTSVLKMTTDEISSAIEAHEGTLDAQTPDAVTGIFGLPVVHEDDPVRAMLAAEKIGARLSELGDRLAVGSSARLDARIGISTGEVMTGGGAGGIRATGAPLVQAGRLAQEAEPFTVASDERTQRIVTSRRDGTRFSSPMVGRERERRRLHDAFEQAVTDGSCQLFTILGTAGVGKSRLVQEFLREIDPGALVARGRCLPYGDGITFWPVLEAIKDLGHLEDPVTVEEVQRSLLNLVGDEREAEDVVRRVCELAGLAESAASVEEAFNAVRSFLELVAKRRPLVVVFDDVHWGEERFLDLVEHVADWSRGAPTLLVCIARPELLDVRPSWGGGKLNATSVLLEPLTDDQTAELVANLVGPATLGSQMHVRIAGAAEGNPLFVEEVVSMLIDDGVLVREDGQWTAKSDLAELPVPPTIQALLAARLDQLSTGERSAIEAAAVEGMVFHESSVITLLRERGTVDSSALASLVRKELVRPERPVFAGERAFRFRHLMIRDAAYDAIPKEARAVLHEDHADWLEERIGEHSVEFDEIAGYHLEQAVRYRRELGRTGDHHLELCHRAALRLGAAGRRAFQRGDAPAGTNLVSRATALLSGDDPLRVELVPNLRAVQGDADLGWADRILTESVEAAATTGDRHLAAHALVQRGLLRLFSDPGQVTPDELLDVSRRAIATFEELGDDLGLARALRLAAQAHYLGGRLEACAASSERALEHALRAGNRFEESEITAWLLVALIFGPCPVQDGLVRCRRLLEGTTGTHDVRALVAAALAWFEAADGNADDVRRLVDDALGETETFGQIVPLAFYYSASALMLLADWVEAERVVRMAYEPLRALGRTGNFGSLAVALAQIQFRQGRDDEGERLLVEARRALRANDIWDQVHEQAEWAKLLARRGEVEAAERAIGEVLQLAANSDFLTSQADVQMDLGEVFRIAGRPRDAMDALERAIALHHQKGNVVEVQRGRALWEELGGVGL